jgi:exodeoxyribonuclease VII small subunit
VSSNEPSVPSFEEALTRLEAIVHDLEEGAIGLEEALARYEQGVRLLKQCSSLLEKAERKIELLTGIDSSGSPLTSPLDDESQTLEQKSQARGRRRSASTSPQMDKCINVEVDAP